MGNGKGMSPERLAALARGRAALRAKWEARERERLEAYGRALGLTEDEMRAPVHPLAPSPHDSSDGAMYAAETLRNYPALGYFVVAAGLLKRERGHDTSGSGNGSGAS